MVPVFLESEKRKNVPTAIFEDTLLQNFPQYKKCFLNVNCLFLGHVKAEMA